MVSALNYASYKDLLHYSAKVELGSPICWS